jgi:hypothetical protein
MDGIYGKPCYPFPARITGAHSSVSGRHLTSTDLLEPVLGLGDELLREVARDAGVHEREAVGPGLDRLVASVTASVHRHDVTAYPRTQHTGRMSRTRHGRGEDGGGEDGGEDDGGEETDDDDR